MRAEKPKRIIGADGVVRSPEAEQELNLLCARAFRGDDGKALMNYLKSITINAVMGDKIDNTNTLIHREGQRFIVGLIDRRIENGRNGKPGPASIDPGPDPSGR